MTDTGTDLTIRPADGQAESYRIAWEHPDAGKIDVGTISRRSGNPVHTDPWQWSVGYATLPSRHWKQGTAPTRKAAERAWKVAWLSFRAARSEAEWHDAKAEQDYAEKRVLITRARQLPGLTANDHERLRQELGSKGPAPRWLIELLAGH